MKRNRRKLRIRAYGADRNKFLYLKTASILDHLKAHDSAVIKELARTLAVGSDPAHDRRQMNYNVRTGVLVQANDTRLITEIILLAAGDKNLLASMFTKFLNHKRAEKSPTSCYQHSLTFPRIHRSYPLYPTYGGSGG